MKDHDEMPMPKVRIPVDEPRPAELERRRRAAERILALRSRLGPVGIRASDLLREFREERGSE